MAMEAARHFCKQKHGDLVTIDSDAESVFLWKQVSINIYTALPEWLLTMGITEMWVWLVLPYSSVSVWRYPNFMGLSG